MSEPILELSGLTKVYPGGELVDVELDNGEGCKRIPTWEVFPA